MHEEGQQCGRQHEHGFHRHCERHLNGCVHFPPSGNSQHIYAIGPEDLVRVPGCVMHHARYAIRC